MLESDKSPKSRNVTWSIGRSEPILKEVGYLGIKLKLIFGLSLFSKTAIFPIVPYTDSLSNDVFVKNHGILPR